MKKILLINPPKTDQSGFTNPPLGLLYLAGTLIKNGFEVKVVDGCIDGKKSIQNSIISFKPELIGITCLTPARKHAIEVAEMAKKINPNIKVIMGGAHPTIMYRQMLENYPFIDYIVLGEGEITLLELAQEKDPSQINGLAYKQGGEFIVTPLRKYVENLDDLPFPAWHLIDLKKYPAHGKGIVNGINLSKEPRVSVVFSRGCIGNCDFCSTWWIWRGWRRRSPKNMVDELEILNREYGIKHICFADDTMTVDRQATIDLCEEIISRKLKIAFHITTRTDCIDEVVLKKLKNAGCYEISYGIESGSQMLLEKMKKKNDIQTSERAIKITKKAGIRVTALVITGNVGETKETVEETINFLKRTRPDDIGCVGGLWILPGTKLYHDCKNKGFIDDDFWLTDEPYKLYTYEYSLKELLNFQAKIRCYNNTIKRIIYSNKGLYNVASSMKSVYESVKRRQIRKSRERK